METSTMIAAASLAITILVLVATLARQSAVIEGVIKISLERHRREIDEEIDKLRREIVDAIDRHSREIGETVAAARQKMSDMELFNRDTFMRRESFFEIVKSSQEAMNNLGDRVENRLQRMENKIDGMKA